MTTVAANAWAHPIASKSNSTAEAGEEAHARCLSDRLALFIANPAIARVNGIAHLQGRQGVSGIRAKCTRMTLGIYRHRHTADDGLSTVDKARDWINIS
ncbi:MAG: hypothetical protein WBP53_12120 [Dokdonella sp.]